MGIPASIRLRKPSDFQQVRTSEHRVHCGPFVIQCEPGAAGQSTPTRLGVIASRRVGNAVVRNRGKRIVRELFRRHADKLPQGSQCVVVLRSKYRKYSFAHIEEEFIQACSKISASAFIGGDQ